MVEDPARSQLGYEGSSPDDAADVAQGKLDDENKDEYTSPYDMDEDLFEE